VLFVNLAVLLKLCFTRINTCLCDLIECADEESLGLYIQTSVVKNTQPLIDVNFKSDKWKGRIVHIGVDFDFVCDFEDLFNSVYLVYTLVLGAFYVVIFICDA
jgi:hypothetical protein